MTSIKKSLIITLIILILAGLGYFVYSNKLDNKNLEVNVINNNYSKKLDENINIPPQNNVHNNVIDKSQNQEPEISDTVPLSNSNTITTYMCDGKVKIVKEQDSPSLPPRISYLRVKDNAQVAYYGDMGAYIRPEYFSIDRSKIEEGYSFNEVNFCKYLKK